VAIIRDYDVFADFVTYKGMNQKEIAKEKAKQAKWNAFKLLPNPDTGEEIEGYKYTMKIICKNASDGTWDDYERLYNEAPLADIWELIAIKRAVNY
jgi:hypothetical protein